MPCPVLRCLNCSTDHESLLSHRGRLAIHVIDLKGRWFIRALLFIAFDYLMSSLSGIGRPRKTLFGVILRETLTVQQGLLSTCCLLLRRLIRLLYPSSSHPVSPSFFGYSATNPPLLTLSASIDVPLFLFNCDVSASACMPLPPRQSSQLIGCQFPRYTIDAFSSSTRSTIPPSAATHTNISM